MRFSQHTVGHTGFITIYDGTFVRLTPDQYRRRKHKLTDVERSGECYIGKVKDWVVFKVGEVFEIEGALPKSYWAMVTDPPHAVAAAPVKKPETGAMVRELKKSGDKAKAAEDAAKAETKAFAKASVKARAAAKRRSPK